MGYNTDFTGFIGIHKNVDNKTIEFLHGLSNTRRMMRNPEILARKLGITKEECISKYGEEGQYYFNEGNNLGQEHTEDIINYNCPPSGQPSLWCNWRLGKDNRSIEWNNMEKFIEYIPWMKYIVEELKNRNYILNGTIFWYGDENNDRGKIIVKDNIVNVIRYNLAD